MPRHPDRDDGIKPCTGPKRRRECAAGKDDIRGSERTKKERVLGTKTKEAAAAPRGGKGGRPFSAVKRSARHARCPFASTGIKRGGVAGRPALPARPFLFVRPGLLMEEPAARAGARPAPACHWDLLAWPAGPRIAGPRHVQASPRRGQHIRSWITSGSDESSAGQREERTRALIEMEIPVPG